MDTNVVSITSLKKRSKRFEPSLEYGLIASLALQRYATKGEPDFASLLSISLDERIPSLIREYGLKRMQRLIRTMLQEFCHALQIPKSKKLTETRLAVCACDLMLVAEEDQLALEDLVVFFALAQRNRYGKFKGFVTHAGILEMLSKYRMERQEFYHDWKEKRAAEHLQLGPVERISPEPRPIRDLFEEAHARIIPFRKIS